MSDYKNEGGLIWKDMASPGCHIYIHKFGCDLTKGADACYTQENLGKHTRETNCREREKEKHLMIDYHIYINLWGSGMPTKGLLSEVTSEIVCPINICGGG